VKPSSKRVCSADKVALPHNCKDQLFNCPPSIFALSNISRVQSPADDNPSKSDKFPSGWNKPV